MTTVSKVYQAISNVQAELAKIGIAKDGQNTMQNYKFRGIDQIYQTLAPLLAKNNLVIIPRATERHEVERVTKKGGIVFYVTVKCEFDFVSSEDGSTHTASMYGEAMDSGDKATNKAMSAAYKYLCLETFCIPTEGDNDADASSHEVEPKKKTTTNFEFLRIIREQKTRVGDEPYYAVLGVLGYTKGNQITDREEQLKVYEELKKVSSINKEAK